MKRFMRNLTVLALAFAFASTSQSGLLSNLLPRPSTVIVVGAVAAVIIAPSLKKRT